MMSISSYYLVRSVQVCSLKPVYRCICLPKRSYSCFAVKKDSSSLRLTNKDCHPIFTVCRRTLRKYAAALGGFGTSYLKPKHKEDKISREFEFVYGSPNTRWYIWWTPMIYIVITVILVICAQTIYSAHWLKEDIPAASLDETFSFSLDTVNPVETAYVLAPIQVMLLFTILFYTRSNLLRLYYNKRSKDFVAIILKYGLYKKKLPFKQSDVKFTKDVGLKGNVYIKGDRLIVTENNFISTPAYNIFMGYDIARPSDSQEKMKTEDFQEAFKRMVESREKYASDKFVKQYREKRKKTK